MSSSTRRRARWIVYSILAALAVLALGVLLYLRSGRPERWARERLVQELERVLGRPVTVERVRLAWLPPGAVVEGLRSAPPLLAAERVEADISLRALLRGRVLVKDVDIVRPVLQWDIDTQKLFEPLPPREGPPRVTLRRLRLRDGTLLVGSRRRALEADIEGLSAQVGNVTGAAGMQGPWAGGLRFARGRFRFGDFQLAGTAGSLTFESEAGAVRFQSVHLRADGVEVRGRGEMLPGEPRRARLDFEAGLDPSSPAVSRPLPQFGAKHVDLTLQIFLPGEGVKITGAFTAQQPTIDQDRTAAGDGPRPAWTGSLARGTVQAEGGALTIEGDIEGFSGGTVHGVYRGSADQPRRHSVTVEAEGLDLADVLRHADLPGDPAVSPSGSVSGRAEMAWAGSALDQAQGTASLLFAERPGDLPVSGEASLSFDGPRVRIVSSSLTAPGTRIGLDGRIDFSRAPAGLDLGVDAAASDADPLMGFLSRRFRSLFLAGDGSRRLPISPTDLEGSFDARLDVAGTTGRPEVTGSMSSGGVRFSLPAGVADPGAGRVPLALDRLEAGFSWTPDRFSLSVAQARGEGLALSAELSLDTGSGRTAVSRLHVEADEIPADLALTLAGLGMEAGAVSGALRLSADLSGQAGGQGLASLKGPLSLSAPLLEVKGMTLEDVVAHGALSGGMLRLQDAHVATLGGTIVATGQWRTAAPPAGRTPEDNGLDVTLTGLDLASIRTRFGGPQMTGTVQAQGRLAGGGDGVPMRLDGTVQGVQVAIGGLEVGDVAGTLSGTPDRVRFEMQDRSGALRARGEMTSLTQGAPVLEAQVTARPFDLERLRSVLPAGALAGLRGDADADLVVSGPLALRELTVRAQVDRLSLAAGEYTLRNEGPLHLSLLDGFLTLATGRLVGDRTNLELGGSMNLGGAHEASLRLEGTFDLGIIELLSPEMRAAGPASIDIRIVEREDGTSYGGVVHLDGASLQHPSLPQPLERLAGSARFEEGGVLRIEQLSFDTGGGHVRGEGWARFAGASMPEAHLELTGSGIRAELLPDLRAFFDARVTLDKEAEDYRFTGQVEIVRAIYARAFGLEPTALLLRNREFGPAPARRGPAPNVFLDLRIGAERDLWIRNEDALIEAAANLTLGGTLDQPELYGRIQALEGGTYRFRDVTYRIEGGSIEFTDVSRIDPELAITAVTRVQQYDVRLKISGRFSRPLYELSSEPPLPQSDIVWLLVTGRTLTESGSDVTRAAAEAQVAGYLAAPVAGAVTAPLGRLLGVSSLQIDPTLLNGTADPTARVTVSKRIARDLLFTYSSSLGQSGQEVYQVEYNPGRVWDLLGTRDLDGSIGADIRIRRRWHGWGWEPEGRDAASTEKGQGAAGRVRVGAVRIVADRLVDTERALRRRVRVDAGDPLRRGELLEARETLRQHYVEHGYPAAQVDMVESEPRPAATPGGGQGGRREAVSFVDVTYTIVAGPRHEVRIEGDLRQRPIRRAVQSAWQEPILLEDLVEEARLAAERVLHARGRYSAQVEARIESPEPDKRLVVLEPRPGPRVHVRSVTITGNTEMPEERIRRQMLTQPGGILKLVRRGLLKREVLEDDIGSIRALYLANGFLDVEVAPPQVALSEDGTQADVTVRIIEGPTYHVGSVSLEGDVPGVEGAAMLKAINLGEGQNLTLAVVSGGADRLRTLLDSEGYTQARVTHRLEGQPSRMRVVYAVSAGDRARIARVSFSGNDRTNDRTIHREITLDAGDYLTRAGMLSTQRNLYRLGVFRSVDVETVPSADQPGEVDVHFKLVEGPPILTAWGVGYDTEDGPRASFELADNNLFGTRRSAGLFLRASPVDRRVQVTLRDPNLFGERIETLISAFIEEQETDSFVVNRLGAGAQLSRKLTDTTTLYGRYRLEDVDLSDLKVAEEEVGQQTVRLGHIGASLARDTRDDIVYPTRGGLTSIDVRTYGPAFGSEEQFLKVFTSGTNFQDIGKRIVWASAVRGGLISSRDIPISERFFAGGDTTLRGFSYNTVGPRDPETGKALGGQGIFLLNQELRFPIYKAFTGVVFWDAGNVFGDFSDWDLGDLRHTLGLGLRVSTPVGPFRVEYGHKMDREDGESRGEIFFSIGQAF
jgi:outer membrane protein insertion porin family